MRSIDQLIQEEMAASAERVMRLVRSAVVESLDHSHALLARQGARRPAVEAPSEAPEVRRKRRASANPPAARRSREEIDDLSNRFLDAVRASPGETMETLAPRVQVKAGLLQVPVARLKRAGRVKTVGQRQFTRYFPTDNQVAA